MAQFSAQASSMRRWVPVNNDYLPPSSLTIPDPTVSVVYSLADWRRIVNHCNHEYDSEIVAKVTISSAIGNLWTGKPGATRELSMFSRTADTIMRMAIRAGVETEETAALHIQEGLRIE